MIRLANYKQSMRNPAAEYLFKIQRIVSNTEFKNDEEAALYETLETKTAGGDYCRAVLGTDTFDNYQYDAKYIYAVLDAAGYPFEQIQLYLKNPHMLPNNIKNYLVEKSRAIRIATYVEMNKYYANLAGLPFTGTDEIPADVVVTIPDGFFAMFQDDPAIYKGEPIHKMPKKYQELFMNSEYYQPILNQFPDARYLRYIGSNAVPIEVSRMARDGDIMRINTSKLSVYHRVFGNVTVTPDIIHTFTTTYLKTRNYIYDTLRGDFSNIYVNYNNMIRFLTIYMAIGSTLSELMKKSSSMAFMNNATANNYFVLYGLPSVIMEGQSMISFMKKFRLLLADKGTNVVYRVKDLIGYQYTDIYTLVMVKQQVFEKGVPIYEVLPDGTRVPKQRIVFRRFGTTDDNTSYFKFRESTTEYDWKEIASGDPRWWNTPETEQMLTDMNYTLSNSKYIQLSTHVSMSDIFWQSIILLRGLLDLKSETMYTRLNVGYDINGTSDISVFDAVLALIVLMNWHVNTVRNQPLTGELYLPNNGVGQCIDMLFNGLRDDGSPNELKPGLPFKLTSFNFGIRNTDPDFYQYELPTFDYLEPDIFIPMLDQVLDRQSSNAGEVLMHDVRSIYDYLENKLQKSLTIEQFRQVTDTLQALFLVDPNRKWDSGESRDTDTVLMETYDLTSQELSQFKYYTTQNPETIDVVYNETTYHVPLSSIMNTDVSTISIDDKLVFTDNGFMSAFRNTMDTWSSNQIERSTLSNSVKLQYKDIISDKVELDIGNSINGPTTFSMLLYRSNPQLFRRLNTLRGDGDTLLILIRSIIKALESYTSSSLAGLEFSALGADDYFTILKEVISYFKSYMVEFTKEEFQYIMDGLFDQGGNSNMMRLYDEIHSMNLHYVPTDSLTMFDVSYSDLYQQFADDNVGVMYDGMSVRATMKYSDIVQLGYDIWFDHDSRITKNKPSNITGDSEVSFTLLQTDTGYNCIIKV